jgi:hypothetical protein
MIAQSLSDRPRPETAVGVAASWEIAMPFCTQCGKQNLDVANFCAVCGARLIKSAEPALVSSTLETAVSLAKAAATDASDDILKRAEEILNDPSSDLEKKELYAFQAAFIASKFFRTTWFDNRESSRTRLQTIRAAWAALTGGGLLALLSTCTEVSESDAVGLVYNHQALAERFEDAMIDLVLEGLILEGWNLGKEEKAIGHLISRIGKERVNKRIDALGAFNRVIRGASKDRLVYVRGQLADGLGWADDNLR